MRKYYLCRKDDGLLYSKKDQPAPDPMVMLILLKVVVNDNEHWPDGGNA